MTAALNNPKIIIWTALLAVGFCWPAKAETAPNRPMTFAEQGSGGNCNSCAWILAEGVIVPDTPERFREYIKTRKREGIYTETNLRLNAPGGNLLSALKLGRLFRSLQLDTYVGSAGVLGPGPSPGHPSEFDQPSDCYSACVYAFLGGVNRFFDPLDMPRTSEGVLGIHQFYGRNALTDPLGKSLSATDAASIQRLYGILSAYVREMGADARLVELAAQTTPWQPVHILTAEELISLGVITNHPPASSWTIKPVGDGVVAAISQPEPEHEVITFAVYCTAEHAPMLYVSDYRPLYKWTTADERALNEANNPDFDRFLVDGQEIDKIRQRRSLITVQRDRTASFKLRLSKQEVEALLRGNSLELSVDEPHIFGFDLGGKVSLKGAATMVPIALRNCI